MPSLFQFRKMISGRKIHSFIYAENNFEALLSLEANGVSVSNLKVFKYKFFSSKKNLFRELLFIFQTLSKLLKEGISLQNSIEILMNSTDCIQIKALFFEINYSYFYGISIQKILKKYSFILDDFTTSTLINAEKYGEWKHFLERLCEYYEFEFNFVKNKDIYLAYPILLIAITFFIGISALKFLVPTLCESEDYLKFLTNGGAFYKLIFNFSQLLNKEKFWYSFLFFIFTTLILLFKKFNKIVLGKKNYENKIWANNIQKLSILLMAKFNPINALEEISKGKEKICKHFLEIKKKVYSGKSLSNAFSEIEKIPFNFIKYAQIGEETGAIGKLLYQCAEIEQASLVHKIENRLKFINFLMILISGIILIVILLAIIMPLYNHLYYDI